MYEVDKLQHLGEIIGKDLAGFRLAPVFWLELEHGCMGNFPALIAGSREIIFTSDRSTLRVVWGELPRKSAKIRSQFALVHQQSGIAFPLYAVLTGEVEAEEMTPIHIRSKEDLERMISHTKEPFAWAPGLIDFEDKSMTRDPDFGC